MIGLAMIITALANAGTNIVNMRLLRPHRERGVHLQASWIFTTNDMIGLVIVGIVVKGGWDILQEAGAARHGSTGKGEGP